MLTKIKTSLLLQIFIVLLAILFIASGRDFFSKPPAKNAPDSGELKTQAATVYDYCEKNASLSKGKENCYAEELQKIAEKNGPELSF